MFNSAKNVNGICKQTRNTKLIALNDKMPTNNMIKSK